jgi:hypothetical protein
MQPLHLPVVYYGVPARLRFILEKFNDFWQSMSSANLATTELGSRLLCNPPSITIKPQPS